MPSYPGSVKSFGTPHKNYTDIINDFHVNDVADEVVAIETALGTNPAQGTTKASSSVFTNNSTLFSSVSARIANVEGGVVGDSHTQYAHLIGGDTIAPGTGVVGLKFQGVAGSGDLVQWKNPAGSVVSGVDVNGNFYTGSSALGTTTDINNLYILHMFNQI